MKPPVRYCLRYSIRNLRVQQLPVFEDFGLEQQFKSGKIKMWKQDKVDIVYMMT